jgi:hypothetical protein
MFFCSGNEIPVVRLSGHELTKEYLESNGFNYPIIVDRKDGLDMRVPPSNFSIQDVENYVGEFSVQIIIVYKNACLLILISSLDLMRLN